MKGFATELAAAMALTGTSAQAAAQTCLTPAEMNSMITYFLPKVIDEVVETCSPHLPASSYLRTRLGGRADDLRSQADAVWPQARSAFMKIGGSKSAGDLKEMEDMPEEALRSMIDVGFISSLGINIKSKACGEVNDISEALAPLSTAQAVHLVAVTLAATARDSKSMASCPRSETNQG